MEFKSIDEYYREFINSGKENFYDFLEGKLQEAQKSENQELANHIEYLQMDVANQEFYEKEMAKREEEERRNWVDYSYEETSEEVPADSDKTETIEENAPVQMEKENKKSLLDELSNARYYLSELNNRMNVEDFHAKYESFEIDDMWRERLTYEEKVKQLENEIYMIEMDDLGTSLPSMNPEDIKKEYYRLLEKRKLYTEMVDDGYEVDDLNWEINKGLIEMVEEYIRVNPELEDFVESSNDEFEPLLTKEMKSKSIGDARFEVNEFGEIIKPSKSLREFSVEDLSKLEEEMDQEIDANNEKIKQAQIDRLLAKQKIIREQRKMLKELEGQPIDFDD